MNTGGLLRRLELMHRRSAWASKSYPPLSSVSLTQVEATAAFSGHTTVLWTQSALRAVAGTQKTPHWTSLSSCPQTCLVPAPGTPGQRLRRESVRAACARGSVGAALSGLHPAPVFPVRDSHAGRAPWTFELRSCGKKQVSSGSAKSREAPRRFEKKPDLSSSPRDYMHRARKPPGSPAGAPPYAPACSGTVGRTDEKSGGEEAVRRAR